MATPVFNPTRTKWWGVRTSNPGPLTQADQGTWIYRSDLKLFAYWDGVIWHYIGGTGGFIFNGTATYILPAAGDYEIVVSLSAPWVPTTINHLLDVHFINVSPVVDPGSPVNPVITAPQVGFTLVGVGAGCTLTARVECTGW